MNSLLLVVFAVLPACLTPAASQTNFRPGSPYQPGATRLYAYNMALAYLKSQQDKNAPPIEVIGEASFAYNYNISLSMIVSQEDYRATCYVESYYTSNDTMADSRATYRCDSIEPDVTSTEPEPVVTLPVKDVPSPDPVVTLPVKDVPSPDPVVTLPVKDVPSPEFQDSETFFR
ncbi:hypothetical protein RUM43_015051 [Polyplax serrata]|uniref:Uncharacterized protein n=1 Tax=Polyplax serrata TaxID=468196 RepID=A0AAN8PPX9_POLSC